MSRTLTLFVLLAVGLLGSHAAQAAPLPAAPLSVALPTAASVAMPLAGLASGEPVLAVSVPLAMLPNLFGAPGLNSITDYIEDLAEDFRGDFMRWGTSFYALFFAIQFLLLGITMVVRGPFAIASYRPIHPLNPFANFFFFLLAGALGYMFVANSAYIDASGEATGWVQWLYEWFNEMGDETGCTRTVAFGLVGSCDAEGLAWIGMRLSGILLVLSESAGNSAGNPINWLVNSAGASTAVFSSFSVLAIQLTLVKAAFMLCIVTAPMFLSVIVFQPLSGIANGFISFIVYLGVKLFILKMVAGVASFVAGQWLEAIMVQFIGNMLTSLIFGTGIDTGSLFGFNLSVLTSSLLFLSLTLYLPTKVAGMVSQRLTLDLNGILFRGEFPIQIA